MEVPVRASEAAAALARLFEQDARLAELQNDAQHRLQDAAQRLWSGPHPDALGRLYDDTHRVGIGDQFSVRSEVAAVSEERRQLADTVGELTRELVEVLTDAGWSEHDARNENVHELANPAWNR